MNEKGKKLKLQIMSGIVLIGFFSTVVYFYVRSAYLGMTYPFSSPFCYPPHFMTDFTGDIFRISTMDPYHTLYLGYGNNYPPFAYLSTVPFSFWGEKIGRLLMIATLLLGFWGFLWREYRIIKDDLGTNFLILAIFGLLTYPMLFELDRLNAEGLIFLWLLGFWILFQKKHFRLAAFCLGAATASKVYPGMFIFLFIAEKRYREVGIWLLTVAGLSFLSLAIFKTSPLEMLRVYAASAPKIHEMMLTPNFVFQHSSNLLGMIRAIQAIVWPQHVLNLEIAQKTHSLYHAFIGIPALLTIIAIIRKNLDTWEKLTLIVISIVLLPTVSFDYKLIHFFIPIAAFINAKTSRTTAIVFSIFFGLILIPKAYYLIYFDTNSQVISNPIILTLMATILIKKALFSNSTASNSSLA